MVAMAKDKQPPVPTEPEKKGKPISYRPHVKLSRSLKEYVNSFDYPPSYSDILDDALAAFLAGQGYDVPDLAAERKVKEQD